MWIKTVLPVTVVAIAHLKLHLYRLEAPSSSGTCKVEEIQNYSGMGLVYPKRGFRL